MIGVSFQVAVGPITYFYPRVLFRNNNSCSTGSIGLKLTPHIPCHFLN